MSNHLRKRVPRLPVLLWLMLMALLPLQISARDFEYEGLIYTVLDEDAKTVSITNTGVDYQSISGDIVIPATVSDGETEYSVTTLGNNAFSHCDAMTSIVIPNSVTSIGTGAFYYCFYPPLDEMLCFVPAGDVEVFKAQYPNGTVLANNMGFQYAGADNQFEIRPNDNQTLTLSLQGAANVNGFQFDIELPEGISITADEARTLDVSFGEGCAAASHSVSAAKVSGTNRYRIVAFSSANDVFSNGEGLLNIGISADQNLAGSDITVEDITLSIAGGVSFEAEPRAAITVPSFISVESLEITPLYCICEYRFHSPAHCHSRALIGMGAECDMDKLKH